jgi:hypothetical protein
MDQSADSPAIFNIYARLESCFQRMERILQTLETNADPKVQLAGAAEMRKHVALAAQTLEIALRADALRDFQRSVLEILAEADVKTRRNIIGLFEARAAEDQ